MSSFSDSYYAGLSRPSGASTLGQHSVLRDRYTIIFSSNRLADHHLDQNTVERQSTVQFTISLLDSVLWSLLYS